MNRKGLWMTGLFLALTACITAPPAPPPQPEVHLRNGVELLKKGNCRAAQEQFEKALRWDPDNFRAHFGLGASALVCDRRKKAERELEIALRLAPTPVWKDRVRTLLSVAEAEAHHHKKQHRGQPRRMGGVDVDLIIVWMEE